MATCEKTCIAVTTGDCSTQELTEGWQIDKKLGECMVQMFDARLWTDVTFRCADQSEENLDDRVHAHKIVLAARSPVFQAMLFGQWMDTCNNTTIEIQDAQGSHFKMFLRCLYSDSIDGKEDMIRLTHVLYLAHKYQANFLVDKCCQELEGKTTIDNVFLQLERALLYENAHFVETVTKCIDENAERILKNDGFLDMSLECLTHILKGDTFYVSETLIFNKAMEWARKRCESTDGLVLRKTLGEAFYFLRTPAMTLEEFTTCTKRKGYYTIDEYEDVMESMNKTVFKQTENACNSRKKRTPLKLFVEQPDVPNPKDEKKLITKKILSESVTITVNTDVRLTHIKLKNHSYAFHEYSVSVEDESQSSSKRGREREINETKKFWIDDARLSVSFGGDCKDVEKYYFVSNYDSCMVELRKPILLSSRKSFSLEVDIELDVIPGFKLQLQAFPRESANYFNCKNDFLSIETNRVCVWSSKSDPEVIRGFKFEWPHNR